MKFTPDQRGIAALASTQEMRRFLQDAAQDAVDAAEAQASSFLRKRAEFEAEVVTGPDGAEGRAMIRSSFWHWDEFGTSKMPARSPLRNGAQQALNRRGGRLGRSR